MFGRGLWTSPVLASLLFACTALFRVPSTESLKCFNCTYVDYNPLQSSTKCATLASHTFNLKFTIDCMYQDDFIFDATSNSTVENIDPVCLTSIQVEDGVVVTVERMCYIKGDGPFQKCLESSNNSFPMSNECTYGTQDELEDSAEHWGKCVEQHFGKQYKRSVDTRDSSVESRICMCDNDLCNGEKFPDIESGSFTHAGEIIVFVSVIVLSVLTL